MTLNVVSSRSNIDFQDVTNKVLYLCLVFFLGHANVQDFHNHEQVATKAGKLSTNDEIIFFLTSSLKKYVFYN